MTFILASASEARARLLRGAGVAFDVVPARIDEDAVKHGLKGEPLERVPDALAEMKALRVSGAHPGALVLGADQVLAFEGAVISKSGDLREAGALLTRLRGRTHRLIGALVLAKDGAPVWRHVETSSLTMRGFSDAFLDDYLAREGEAALSSVGCYRFEGLGAQLFAKVEGDYFSILGLSLLPLLAALREHGVVAA